MKEFLPLLSGLGAISQLLMPASQLAAQSTSDLPSLAQLEAILDTATSSIEGESFCGRLSGSNALACNGMVALRWAELGSDRAQASKAERLLGEAARDIEKSPVVWRALGRARLELNRLGGTSKPGPLQIEGVSLLAGASNAFIHSFLLDTMDTRSLLLLAALPVPREGGPDLASRIELTRTFRKSLDGIGLLGAARAERAAGSRDTALAFLESALATGEVDSAVAYIELSREMHAVGLDSLGLEALISGAHYGSDIGRSAYRAMLALVGSPVELADWDSLAVVQRPAWLRHFWGERDMDGGWPAGARLAEHFRRLEYAVDNFTIHLPPSGRHALSTRTGGVDTFVDELIARRLRGPEGLGVAFSKSENITVAQQEAARTALAVDDLLSASGLGSAFRANPERQTVFDDRGLVWLRYGAPTKRVRSVGGEALEVWRYDNVNPPLVAQFREENFDGQIGASVLVPSLLDLPANARDQFCMVEPSLCTAVPLSSDQRYDDSAPLAESIEAVARQRSDFGRMNVASIDRAVSEGKRQVARATSADEFRREFDRELRPVIQAHRFQHRPDGRPYAVVSVALPTDQLMSTRPPEAGGRIVFPVTFTISVLDSVGHRIDQEILKQFATPTVPVSGSFLTTLIEVPIPAGRLRGTLMIRQDSLVGASIELGTLGVASPGALGISSIALGLAGSPVAWHSGSERVHFNPLGAFTEGGEATLYYQLTGLIANRDVRTTMEFFDADRDDQEAALKLGFTDQPRSESIEVSRTIRLENLKPGRYRLRVTVEQEAFSAVAERVLVIRERQ